MVNIEATTPQLRVVKGLADALVSRDLSNAEPILSKDFILKSFPKAAELPDLTKEEYLQKYSAVLALFGKMEVRTQHLGIACELSADIHKPQIVFHEVIEAPEKVVLHVRPSAHHQSVSDSDTQS